MTHGYVAKYEFMNPPKIHVIKIHKILVTWNIILLEYFDIIILK